MGLLLTVMLSVSSAATCSDGAELVADLVAALEAPPSTEEEVFAAAKAQLKARIDAEDALSLQDGSRSRLWLHEGPAPRGTLVMYHGFSAGTWQYEFLAQQAFEAGFNVYVPRLPGHGYVDAEGRPDSTRLPDGRSWERYEAFADQTYRDAAALGGPVSTVGLSVGGAVALRVAELHPEGVDKVVVYAPFLNIGQPVGQAVVDTVRFFDALTARNGGRLLNAVPHNWGEECLAQEAAGERAGHCSFTLGNLYGATQFGREVLEGGAGIEANIQFFLTEMDSEGRRVPPEQIYRESGGAGRHGLYVYPASEAIPHPMLHPMEDQGKGHTPELYERTLDFLIRGTTHHRPSP